MNIPKSLKRYRLAIYAFHVDLIVLLVGLRFGAEPVALSTAIGIITTATIGFFMAADTIRKSDNDKT